MIAIAGLAAIVIIGGLIVRAGYPTANGILIASLAYPVGAGVITLCMFLLNLAGFEWGNLLFLLTGAALLGGVVLVYLWQRSHRLAKTITDTAPKHHTAIDHWALAVMLILLSTTFLVAIYWPVSYWDDVGLYDLRGRMWAESGTVNIPTMQQNDYLRAFPPMISLLHSWWYVHGGTNPHVLHFLFFMSFGLYCYALISPQRGYTFGILATLFIVTIPEFMRHAMIAYTNLSSALFMVAGIYPLTQRRVGWREATFFGFLLGLAGWTRYVTEPMIGLALAFIFVGTLLLHRRIRWDTVIAGSLFLCIDALWIVYQLTILGGLSDRYSRELVSFADLFDGRILALAGLWLQMTWAPNLFGGALLVFVLALLWDRASSERALLLVILAFWIAWMITFLIVDQGDVAAFVLATGFRVWMPGALLMMLWVARSKAGARFAQILDKLTGQQMPRHTEPLLTEQRQTPLQEEMGR
jgi:hypothetical protein